MLHLTQTLGKRIYEQQSVHTEKKWYLIQVITVVLKMPMSPDLNLELLLAVEDKFAECIVWLIETDQYDLLQVFYLKQIQMSKKKLKSCSRSKTNTNHLTNTTPLGQI